MEYTHKQLTISNKTHSDYIITIPDTQDVKLARIKIGHTHSFLVKNEDPPNCQEVLTVKHFFD